MSGYDHIWDFDRDTARLIANGANLRDLYDAMLTVRDESARADEISPKLLRSLAEGWTQSPVFVRIRLREVFEGLQVPHGDDYVLSMEGHLGGRHEQEVRLFMLRHDSDLRENLFWRIFEVEGGGEISLTNIDKFSREDLNWHNTVLQLVREGAIGRARVLHSCLEALNRDFSAYRAGWFSQLYNALSPTASEAAADQDLLRLCLGSHVTATVSLGTKHLETVYKAGLLDSAEFASVCGPALGGPRVAAIAVLRMLAGIAASGSAPATDIVEAATYGLAHPHVDVQRAAVKLLVSLGREDRVSSSLEVLSPVVAADVAPRNQRRPVDAPRPDGASVAPALPVQPWTNDDALERFGALLEFGKSALELELALAWLAATENPGVILGPLAKRARKIESDDRRFWLASLVLVAVDPTTPFLPPQTWQRSGFVTVRGEQVLRAIGRPIRLPPEEDKTVLPSLVTRMREVASILQERMPRRRLLATPTDTQGWVDPEVLIERFDKKIRPLNVDLTQAILRVRPAERRGVATALRTVVPAITDSIAVKWQSRESAQLRSNGSPMWVWWRPAIIADRSTAPSAFNPALIPSSAEGRLWDISRRETSDLAAAALGLVCPSSPLALAAVGIQVMHSATSEVNHAAGPVLDALSVHPGDWTVEVAQVVALGMAAQDAGLRTQSVELFASAVPARIPADQAAISFAECQPAVTLNRWTSSFTDAATIAPHAVIDLLTHLLPKLGYDSRGIGALLGVLVDECLRQNQPLTEPTIRNWLSGFAGTSAAAKAAKAALALT